MLLDDKNGWHDFIYNLIYPAILGSMLYDLFSFPVNDKWIYASQIVLVLIYSLDYLHLYHDLKPPLIQAVKMFDIIVDGVIAFAFRLVFAALSHTWLHVAPTVLAVILLLFLLYNLKRHPVARAILLLFTTISVGNAVLCFTLGSYSLKVFFVTVLLIFFAYVLYVFYAFPRYESRQRAAS